MSKRNIRRKRLRMQTDHEIEFTEACGRRLRKLRESVGISQQDFAEMIHASPSDLNMAENGKKPLSLYPFRMACKYLKVSADFMLCRVMKKNVD